jgi:conjugal transfer ATP-binding protein TraC
VRAPIRVVERGALRVRVRTASGAQRYLASGVGYLGAREEDQAHWIGAFRRFLDGLSGPLQVVMRFRPGVGAGEPADPWLPAPDQMRGRDLDFARRLASAREAQRREIEIVSSGTAVDAVTELVNDLGLTVEAAPDPPEHLFGEDHPNAFVDASGWHRSWYLERYPGGEIEPGWLRRLIPPGQHVDLAWHAAALPTGWIVEFLQRQLAAMRSRVLAGDPDDVVVGGALSATEDLQRRLAASEERAFRVSVYLTLTAPSPNALAEAADRVEEAARSAMCRMVPLTFEMAAGRAATLGTAFDPLERSRILDTSSLATLFPWLDADLDQATGLVIGTTSATGMPVLLDPFDQARFANANIGVFGHSGAGKTHLMSSLALGSLALGVQIFVLDPEHEYGELAKAVGGEDVRLALGSGHALNVLEHPGGNDEAAGAAIADAVDLVAIICGELDEAERADVELAVRATFAEEERPLLRDVARRLRGGRAATVLGRWVDGALGRMFSAPTNVDLEAPIVVFGMRELREEMVAPVHFLLAEALWTRIKGRGRRTLLVVDELGLLFDDPTMRRFVVTLARRIRKYDGSLLFATQNPGDLLSTDAGAVVATNPAIHFFGSTRPGEAVRLQRAFSLSGAQRTFIETARRGDFLLSAGSSRVPVRVKSPPWQQALMESTRGRGRPPPLLTIGRRERGPGTGDPGEWTPGDHMARPRLHRTAVTSRADGGRPGADRSGLAEDRRPIRGGLRADSRGGRRDGHGWSGPPRGPSLRDRPR